MASKEPTQDGEAMTKYEAMVGKVACVYQVGAKKRPENVLGVTVTLVIHTTSAEGVALVNRLAAAGLALQCVEVEL